MLKKLREDGYSWGETGGEQGWRDVLRPSWGALQGQQI